MNRRTENQAIGHLAPTGRMIRCGDVVITGGLTAAVPLDPGDTVAATFGSDVTVTVYR